MRTKLLKCPDCGCISVERTLWFEGDYWDCRKCDFWEYEANRLKLYNRQEQIDRLKLETEKDRKEFVLNELPPLPVCANPRCGCVFDPKDYGTLRLYCSTLCGVEVREERKRNRKKVEAI